MVKKHRKWAMLAGTVLIGIASTLVLFTEPPVPSEEPPPQPTQKNHQRIQQQKPEMPPPIFDEEFIPDVPELDKDIVKFLEQFDPERLKQLRHLKEVDPEAFLRMMKESQHEMMKLNELRERDPQRFEQIMKERQMENEIKELSLQCRKSQNNDEKEEIKKDIKTRLEKLFDLREAQRENEIKRMEQELNKLKEKMKTRKTNRDKIIERRQKELIGEEDDMGW